MAWKRSSGATLIGSAMTPVSPEITLGSRERPFKDLFVSANSIYVDGNKVIHSESTTLSITTDLDQHLAVSTSGLGTTRIASAKEVIVYSGDDVNIQAIGDISATSKGRIAFISDEAGENIVFQTKSNLGDIQFRSKHGVSFDAPAINFSASPTVLGNRMLTTLDTIPASSIDSNTNQRLVTDEQIVSWTEKSTVEKGTDNGQLKVDGVDITVYEAEDPLASRLIQDPTHRLVTDAQIADFTGHTKVEGSTNGTLLLDGVQYNVYSHPTGDGNLHVPATGTDQLGKYLKSGPTEGTIAWAQMYLQEVAGILNDTQHGARGGGSLHALATQSVAGFMAPGDKARVDSVAIGATKTENSSVNGNIKINGNETTVYVHPSTHPASIISTDSTRRFVSDTQIAGWEAKESQSNKNQPNGYAGIGADGKISSDLIPSVLVEETYFVQDQTERLALTGLLAGDRAFQLNDSSSWIWDGSVWYQTAIGSTVNIGWDKIQDKPESSPYAIDLAVGSSHFHSNQLILDHITASFTAEMEEKINNMNMEATKTEFSVNNGKLVIGGVEGTVYEHPNTDGSLHLPATGLESEGMFVRAGSTEGSVAWAKIQPADIEWNTGNRAVSDAKINEWNAHTTTAASSTNGNLLINNTETKVYQHPTTDGNLHVPATSTNNSGRVLKAGATAGAISWGSVTGPEITQSATHRLVSDAQISSWTAKQDALGYTPLNRAGDAISGNLNINGHLSMGNNYKVLDLRSSSTESGVLNPIYGALRYGKKLFLDEEFALGMNGVTVYNNGGGTGVTISHKDIDGAPNKTGKGLEIVHNGNLTGPLLGGFWQGFTSKRNAIFVQMFKAKVPVGYRILPGANSTGVGRTDYFMSSSEGTGKWEHYIRVSLCGSSGTFSSAGHIYLGQSETNPGPLPTAEAPLVWYIASSTVYELTDLTVGHGSNTDSDKLDGQEGTYYLDAANMTNFSDTAHGVRGGGTLHAKATAGADGFQSKEHFTKLEGIETGATKTPLPVTSTTAPPGVEGLFWYNPNDELLKVFMNGQYRSVASQSAGGTRSRTGHIIRPTAEISSVDLSTYAYQPTTDQLDVYVDNVYLYSGDHYTATSNLLTFSGFTVTPPSTVLIHIWKDVDKTITTIDGSVITESSIIDNKLQTRSVNQNLVPTSHDGGLHQILSGMANRIKAITGEANWYDAPKKSLNALGSEIPVGTTPPASAPTHSLWIDMN